MSKKSSIALFIAATSALSIASTDMAIDADFILDKNAQKLADEAAKSSACIPIGEGENCW